MTRAPTKFSDFADHAREGFDGVKSLSTPGRLASHAYAVGNYLRLASKSFPKSVTTPQRGESYGKHFYVDTVLTYVTVQHGDDAPIVFVRA